jgi:hypothetical protein
MNRILNCLSALCDHLCGWICPRLRDLERQASVVFLKGKLKAQRIDYTRQLKALQADRNRWRTRCLRVEQLYADQVRQMRAAAAKHDGLSWRTFEP